MCLIILQEFLCLLLWLGFLMRLFPMVLIGKSFLLAWISLLVAAELLYCGLFQELIAMIELKNLNFEGIFFENMNWIGLILIFDRQGLIKFEFESFCFLSILKRMLEEAQAGLLCFLAFLMALVSERSAGICFFLFLMYSFQLFFLYVNIFNFGGCAFNGCLE